MLFCCLWRRTLRLLVINISSSSPPINKLRRLPPAVSQLARSGGTVLITPGCRSVTITAWSQILAQNRDVCLSHLYSTPPLRWSPSVYSHDVWCGKTRMVWLADGEKFWRYINSLWQNPPTWQTDGETDIYRMMACAALRHKIAQQKGSMWWSWYGWNFQYERC